MREVRMAARWATRNPILVVVMAATLGLGIGVNATVFEMIEGLLLRSLPYRQSTELVLINRVPLHPFFMSVAAFDDWKRSSRFLADAALYVEGEANLFGGSEPVHIHVTNVSANLLSVLGITPLQGRLFREEEQGPGQDRVVLLSQKLWHDRFASDTRILGTNIIMNGKKYEVIGVLPGQFDFPAGTDVWVPSAHDPGELRSFGSVGRLILGRLRRGVTIAQANAAQSAWMQGAAGTWMSVPPKDSLYWKQPFVRRLQDQLVGTMRAPVLVIWAAASLVLLIGCINAAYLLLASYAARRNEFGLRRALGMSTSQLVRQLVLEQIVTGLAAGLVGTLLAHLFTAYLKTSLPTTWPRTAQVTFGLPTFLFTTSLSILVGVIVAVQPCWGLARESNSLAAGLVAGRSVGETRRGRRSLWFLSVTQTALVTVALVGSGLFIRTLINLQQVDLGFHAQNLLCLSVSRPETTLGRGPEGAREYYSEAARALTDIPGVEGVSGVDFLPVRSTSSLIVDIRAIGAPSTWAPIEATPSIVMPGYFHTVGIPLMYGRDFDRNLDPKAETTTIVSKSLAGALWGKSAAVGQFVTIDGERPARVIGVVGDIRFFGPRSMTMPAIYLSFGQQLPRSFTFVIRTVSDPMSASLPAQLALRNVSSVQPIDEVSTMEQYITRNLQIPRSLTILLNVLAAVGLSLAIIGTYGSVWFSLRRSRRTLAVHLAVGGTPRALMTRSVVSSMVTVIVGLIAGALFAVAGWRLIESQLYGVRSTDAVVFAATLSIVLAVALASALLASRRILSLDPAIILREEER